MNKELFVNNIVYTFFYTEDLNLWRLIEDNNLLSGYKIDLEVDLNSLEKSINWDEINDFISYLQRRNDKINNDIIEKSSIALKGLFNSIYTNSLTKEVKSNIEFELSGIDYKKTIKSRFDNEYEYDLFFFPYNTIDRNMDVGSFVWRVKIRGNILYGVNCDI